VSAAVVRLLATSSLLDQTHHVERVLDLATAEAIVAADARVQAMDEAAFYDWLAAHVGDAEVGPAATAMLLHEGLLDRDGTTATVTLREKSDRLLERAGFVWSPVRAEQIWSLTKSS